MTGTPDLDAVSNWLTTLYRNAPGYMHISSSDDWHGTTFDNVEAAVADAAAREARKTMGTYFRVCTLAERPAPGKRGGAAQSLALPAMWSDIDFGTDGHKHAAGEDVLPLPPDETAAWAVADRSGLPVPSYFVNSGGGLNAYWSLDKALVITDDNRKRVADLCATWQRALGESARRLGFSYGTGVGDLARVLRLPGTDNLKTGTPRPCRVVYSTGALYTIEQLAEAAAKNAPTPSARTSASTRPPRPPQPVGQLRSEGTIGPFDVLSKCTPADILGPAGWSYVGSDAHGELWLRPSGPDGPPSSKYSARALHGVPVIVCHSEAGGLPSGPGRRLTYGRTWAFLHHRGNEAAAAQDLIAAAAGNPAASMAARRLPTAVLAAIRDQCHVTPWAEPAPAFRPLNHRPASTLAGLLRAVLKADAPDRDRRLRWAAGKAFEHASHGLFEAKAAASALLEAAVTAGLDEDAARSLITSAYRSSTKGATT